MSMEAQAWSITQPINDPLAKLLLIMLANYSNEHHIASVSYERLKTLCGFKSRTTLSNKITLLENERVIQRIPQITDTGGTDTNAYQLLLPKVPVLQPEPQPTPKKPRATQPEKQREKIQAYPNGLNIHAWSLWIDHKKDQFNDRYKSPRSEQIACKKLIELAEGDHDRQLAIVEQSIANTWKGLFPLQENHHGRKGGGQQQADWRAGLAAVFAPDGSPQPGTAEAGTSEIIIDADYLADTTPYRGLAGKTRPHTPAVSAGLSEPGRFESDCGGIRPCPDLEDDQ